MLRFVPGPSLTSTALPYFLLLGLLLSGSLAAQNYYLRPTTLTATYAVVDRPAGAAPGDALLIYQWGGASAPATGQDAGSVNAYNGAGRWATTRITSVRGDSVFFGTANIEGMAVAFVQLVGTPVGAEVSVGNRVVPPFDGRTGGVAYVVANDRITVTGSLDASGAGFAGGAGEQKADDCNFLTVADKPTYAAGSFRGARRGQGITATPTGAELGRAPLGNGGGGGNDHNTGGAGGSNAGAGGGGGKNIRASPFLCAGDYPGIGAPALTVGADRVFFGGGGGAGHSNNTANSGGGSGGGIVFLEAPQIQLAAGATVDVSGMPGTDVGGDGAGGGGAAGSIVLLSSSVAGNGQLLLDGGDGGDVENQPDRCFGPGGGGGGGFLLAGTDLSNNDLRIAQSGGQAGMRTGSTLCGPADAPAQDGKPGSRGTIRVENTVSAFALSTDRLCPGESLRVTDNSSGRDRVEWSLLPSASGFTLQADESGLTVVPTTAGSGRYRLTQTLIAGSARVAGDTLAFTLLEAAAATGLEVVQDGDTVTVRVVGAAGYDRILYDFGDGAQVPATTAIAGYRYPAGGDYSISVTLVNEACGNLSLTPQAVTVGEITHARILEKDPTGCPTFVLTPFDQSTGSYTSRRWSFPGGDPAFSTDEKPTVRYTKPGEYTARLSLFGSTVGADTVATLRVVVFDAPAADFTFANGREGAVQFTNLTEGADTYSWSFGDGAASTERDPEHSFGKDSTYQVTLVAQGTSCRDTVTYAVTVAGTTSLQDLNRLGVAVYPNPTDGRVHISGPAVLTGILDAAGRRLAGVRTEGDLSELPPGLYVLLLRVEGRVYPVRIHRR